MNKKQELINRIEKLSEQQFDLFVALFLKKGVENG